MVPATIVCPDASRLGQLWLTTRGRHKRARRRCDRARRHAEPQAPAVLLILLLVERGLTIEDGAPCQSYRCIWAPCQAGMRR